MRNILIKTAVAGFLCLGLASCADDLNISSIDPQSSPSYDADGLLAKQYATLGLTGQAGPAGKGDMSQDEGESGFYRVIFNLQELCTDEVIWAWQTDTDIPSLTNIAWNSSSVRANWAYQRLAYDITLHNQFISEQTGKMSDDVIAEVRFLRCLNYYYFLDLFHKAPFKDTFNGELPVEKAGKDLYDWIDKELTEIEPQLKEVGAYNNDKGFGRADRGAAYALHARLALNSAVYTDGQVKDFAKAKDYCDKILNSGAYALSTEARNGFSGYEQVFMGDNDQNTQAMKEIIFPIRQDAQFARPYHQSGGIHAIAVVAVRKQPLHEHRDVVSAIKKEFPDEVCTVTGSDSQQQKQWAIDSFQARKKRLIICSIKAAGVGLTLTASSNVVFVELPWTMADLSQCECRAYRNGQKNAVTSWILMGANTIDGYLYSLIMQKGSIASKVTGEQDSAIKDAAYFDELADLVLQNSLNKK